MGLFLLYMILIRFDCIIFYLKKNCPYFITVKIVVLPFSTVTYLKLIFRHFLCANSYLFKDPTAIYKNENDITIMNKKYKYCFNTHMHTFIVPLYNDAQFYYKI